MLKEQDFKRLKKQSITTDFIFCEEIKFNKLVRQMDARKNLSRYEIHKIMDK